MRKLDEEIESWKGFPWAPRREDRELWDEMIANVRRGFADPVEASEKLLTVDPFFIALILEQQKIIVRLKTVLDSRKRPRASA